MFANKAYGVLTTWLLILGMFSCQAPSGSPDMAKNEQIVKSNKPSQTSAKPLPSEKNDSAKPPKIKKESNQNLTSWNMVWLIVPSTEKKYRHIGYGYVLYGNSPEQYVARFNINGNWINNPKINFNSNGFDFGKHRVTYNDKGALIQQWNENPTGHDAFLSTFVGTDKLMDGTLQTKDQTLSCIVLLEQLKADTSLQKWWDYETFIMLKNKEVSLIGLHYKDDDNASNYADGILQIKQNEKTEQYQITSINRKGLGHIEVGFNDSHALVDVNPKTISQYTNIYPGHNFNPTQVVFSGILSLRLNNKLLSFDDVHGQMEIINVKGGGSNW